MERNFKITIPEPCHENWDKMKPKDNGRFCLSCSKTVVNFTNMLYEEIQHYFIQNQNERICGRFKKSQLETMTIQIPSRVLHTQTNYNKMFLLALFIAMGTTLFSCQDKDGKKQKIDKVEIVQDTTPTKHITVGEVRPRNNNSGDTLLPPPPPPKVDQVKFVKTPVNNTEKEKTAKINCKKVVEDESSFVTGAVKQTNAEFPGGIEQFYTFFSKEFKNPDNANAGNLKIRISFAVEKNGSVSYLQSEPVIEQPLEKEIIRVLSLCPKWEPAESNGKKIRIQYSLPIVL
ncbi:hypothetical protein CLU81_3213 [Flavobacterium sp. 9]|uniref:hypothetical protein n=1 Tax=Flavobacterium sp. 9 TaxID=2035198 RepID=UPI000C3507F8|nr:hypothetical protein [Flavobacterium sp. 9]PIF32662.1 hypothetical protein CLU81_3213 [Flavobacterium sp. 9]